MAVPRESHRTGSSLPVPLALSRTPYSFCEREQVSKTAVVTPFPCSMSGKGREEAYRGRDDQGGRRQRHHGAAGLGCSGREALFHTVAVGVPHVVETAEEETHAHNEQEVGEDGA